MTTLATGSTKRATRTMIADGCGCEERELAHRFAAAVASPVTTTPIAREDARCKQRIVRHGIDLIAMLPLPVHHEHDAGNCVTAGLLIVRDPVTRKQNVVRCETVDIDVPADAEIVIEGGILPGVREPEEPFGEKRAPRFPSRDRPGSNGTPR